MRQKPPKRVRKFYPRILGTVGLTAIAFSFGLIQSLNVDSFFPLAQSVQATPATQTVNPVFKPLMPTLQQKTSVPLWLPTYIPESDGAIPLYARLESVNKNEYSILLGFAPDCNGGTACRLGSVSGELMSTKNKIFSGTKVKLTRQRIGYFRDATCGANCSDSTLTWQENGSLYTVALKAGNLNTLQKMANSTILIKSIKR